MKLSSPPFSRHEPGAWVVHSAEPDKPEGLVIDVISVCERVALRSILPEGSEQCIQGVDGQVGFLIREVDGDRAVLDGVGDLPLASPYDVAAFGRS